jgi:predicted dithiol-disulfide oxidoreductase (DUF899 family)
LVLGPEAPQRQAARDELARLEAEQAERNEEIKSKRLDLPWVPVGKECEFDSEKGRKTLAELFTAWWLVPVLLVALLPKTGAHSCSPTTSCSAPARP